jgi:hypothetical protein
MDETMDGRDNLTDTAGHQLDENKLKKYYAVFNLHGDFNNGVPLYIITDTKEEMVNKLNKIYLELTGEKQAPYSIEDMEDDVYMGKKLDHFISDDWASVTDNEQVFKNDISHLKIPPTKID